MNGTEANNAGSDQTLQNAASDQVLHYLQKKYKYFSFK